MCLTVRYMLLEEAIVVILIMDEFFGSLTFLLKKGYFNLCVDCGTVI